MTIEIQAAQGVGAYVRNINLAEIDSAEVEQLRTAVAKLRELSPLWDMYKDGVDLNSIEWAAH